MEAVKKREMLRRVKAYACLLALIFTLLPASSSMAKADGAPTDFTAEEITSTIYEAEAAELTTLSIEKDIEGFSGEGYVSGFTNDTGSVKFHVDVQTTAVYKLAVGYATPHGYKKTNLVLNGRGQGEIELAEVKGFAEAPAGSVLLNEGENIITLEKGWGWYVIDYIKVELAPAPEMHQVAKTLINPNASKETKALLSYLVDHYGKNILSGQQEYPNSKLSRCKFCF